MNLFEEIGNEMLETTFKNIEYSINTFMIDLKNQTNKETAEAMMVKLIQGILKAYDYTTED